mmetsp:Transcript_19354/g.18692  ORF Transcript_19354/g.18692 Transcript_19354/m.18692 type:complete len:233 (-) Transcript_19354:542-1240(-)
MFHSSWILSISCSHVLIAARKALLRTVLLMSLITIIVYAVCPNECSGHGTCGDYDRCTCFKDHFGSVTWTNPDCSVRTCPFKTAFIGPVVKENDIHPMAECSNKGTCTRSTGQCDCFLGYEGVACERTICPNMCNMNGYCLTQSELANDAFRVYSTPWDADKVVGCVCDLGFRGVDCSEVECPSGPDFMGGFGNESGRDCSGRGTCDYSRGTCICYIGFYGKQCQNQASVLS